LKKLKKGFVPHPVLTKNLSRIFKIRLRLLKNRSGRRHGKMGKNGKNVQKWFFGGKR
jgi:hypothetical protein